MSSATKNRKLMDLLGGERDWGSLLGVLTTTFEFDAHFFETDFLPSLLNIGAWNSTGWTSRIRLERGLSELEGIWVAVDQRRYRGRPRSLRIEVRSAVSADGGKLHAKVSIFIHDRAVRVQVSSANLTPTGHRVNREVALSILASEEDPDQASLATQALNGMAHRLAPWWSPTAERLHGLAMQRLDAWRPQKAASSEPEFAWSDAHDPLWRRFVEQWPTDVAVEGLTIVSPFWSEEKDSGPLRRFIQAIRSHATTPNLMPVRLLTEAVADGDGWRSRLPAIGKFDAAAIGVDLSAQAVLPLPSDEGHRQALKLRPLHAKVVLLRGRRHGLAYCGSANFTNSGWGFIPGHANIEAGVIISGPADGLAQTLIPPLTGPIVRLLGSEDGLLIGGEPPDEPIPSFLSGVWLECYPGSSDRFRLRVTTHGELVHGSWSVSRTSVEASLISGAVGAQDELVADLSAEARDGLLCEQEVSVSWWASTQPSKYPVNIDYIARAMLPVAPGGGDVGESALLAYYQGQIRFEDLYPPPPDYDGDDEDGEDPVIADDRESSVDTSNIQSYQVRNFVEALRGVKDDLRAVAITTVPAMRRAVLGAVSPVALAKEIEKSINGGRRSTMAAGFELIELGSCLNDARAVTDAKPEWTTILDEGLAIVNGILDRLIARYPDLGSPRKPFRRYAQAVLLLRSGDSKA